MDPESLSRSRPISDTPPPQMVETLDSLSKDNVPLIERMAQNHPSGTNASRSFGHGSDTEACLDFSNLFFDDLDEIQILSPIRASPLRTVLPEGPSEPTRTQQAAQPGHQPEPAPSTSGRDMWEPNVRVDEQHPHFFNYSGYGCRPSIYPTSPKYVPRSFKI